MDDPNLSKNPHKVHTQSYFSHVLSLPHLSPSFPNMPIFTAALGSVSGIASLIHLLTSDPTSLSHHHHQSSSSSSVSSLTNPSFNFPNCCWNTAVRRHPFHAVKVSVSGDADIEAPNGAIEDSSVSSENVRQARVCFHSLLKSVWLMALEIYFQHMLEKILGYFYFL